MFQPVDLWITRSGELINLVSLMTFAMKQQMTAGQLPTSKLMAEAAIRSALVGAGFLGFGSAANLYSRH